MATMPTFASKPLSSPISLLKPHLSLLPAHFSPLHFNRHPSRTLTLHASPPSSSQATQNNPSTSDKNPTEERIHQIHTIKEFDAALKAAKNRLVVVEYNAKNRSIINGVGYEEGKHQLISFEN